MKNSTILAIDDDPNFFELLELALRGQKFKLLKATDLDESRAILKKHSPDVIITDYRLPEGTGNDILKIANNLPQAPPVILISGFANKKMAIQAANLHVFAIMEKPCSAKELLATIERALKIEKKSAKASPIFDDQNLSVEYKGVITHLTNLEYKILTVLRKHKGKRIARGEIIAAVWGEADVSRNLLDTHLLNLRKKLPFLNDRLVSVQRNGYLYKG